MEIIHLILGKANPNRMNGVNKVVYQLATKQAEFGKTVSVWGITKDLTHNYGERNFETILFKAKKNPFLIDGHLKNFIRMKKGKATFHLHGGWIPTYSTISRFLNKNNIPFVITPHGSYNAASMKQNSLKKKIYLKFFEKALLQRVYKVHSLGESEVEGLQKIFPNDKSYLFPYGFDVSEMRTIKKSNNGEFIIGFMGRIDIFTKGLDILLDAFSSFQKIEPNSKLWIIGDSKERSTLQKIIESNNLEQKVVLWGSKFGKEKEELMQHMHIFVHSSRMEGMPTSVLEASNLGIPSVVSKATNIGSYIRKMNAGIAVENEDPKALATAFNVMNQKRKGNELNKMAENAMIMVREAFNWDASIKEFDKLYS